jgi:hypothetical protein
MNKPNVFMNEKKSTNEPEQIQNSRRAFLPWTRTCSDAEGRISQSKYLTQQSSPNNVHSTRIIASYEKARSRSSRVPLASSLPRYSSSVTIENKRRMKFTHLAFSILICLQSPSESSDERLQWEHFARCLARQLPSGWS